MSQTPNTPQLARVIERNLFGAMLGMLAATVVARVLLLAFHVPEIVLAALLAVGAAAGSFVTHYGSRSAESVVDTFNVWNARLRRLSLRVMLLLLAVAAVIGVLTVLTANYSMLGRVAGTVVATAFAAGALWPMSLLANRTNTQASGLLGMAIVLIVYLLVIPLIWDLDRNDMEMLATSLILGLTAPPGMLFLYLKNLRVTWIAGRIGVAVYAVVIVLFLLATWHPGNWQERGDYWMTGWICAGYGTLAAASLIGMRKLSLDWRWLGVVAAFLAWALVMPTIWGESDPAEKLITGVTSLAVVIAYASLACTAPLKRNQEWLRIGTIFFVGLSAVFLDLAMLFDNKSGLGMLARLSGASAILASCGSLALLVLALLNRSHDESTETTPLTEISEISLNCPRCRKRITIALGDAMCEGCGLMISISVAEGANQAQE